MERCVTTHNSQTTRRREHACNACSNLRFPKVLAINNTGPINANEQLIVIETHYLCTIRTLYLIMQFNNPAYKILNKRSCFCEMLNCR